MSHASRARLLGFLIVLPLLLGGCVPGSSSSARPSGQVPTARPAKARSDLPVVAPENAAASTDRGIVTPVDPGVTTPTDPGISTRSDPGVVTGVDRGIVTPVDPGITTAVDPGLTTPSVSPPREPAVIAGSDSRGGSSAGRDIDFDDLARGPR